MSSIDEQVSQQWAIASLYSNGMTAVSHAVFDLVNRNTGRGHRLGITTGGFGVGPIISGSFTANDYAYFKTPRAVNFSDFSGRGARITTISAGYYSITYVTIFDGPAYASQVLAYVEFSGWGLSVPGGEVGHGVTDLTLGNGVPVDTVELLVPFDPKQEEDPTLKSNITAKDDVLVIRLDGDILFKFNRYDIKPEAERTLHKAGAVIRSRKGWAVEVQGHTDSIGKDAYNMVLSLQRAKAVAQWLSLQKYVKDSDVTTYGWGATRPIANNKKPDGSDDPEGRQKNRRVEILLYRR